MNLKVDILDFLVEKDFRPSEIRKRFFSKYRKTYSSTRAFDVAISRELKKLKADKFVKRIEKGHQCVCYAVTKRGVEELERIRLRNHFTNWIDGMDLSEIKAWLSRFEERGLRLLFIDGATVRDKDGKIKGKGVGVGFQSLEYGTSFIMTVKDKDGKIVQEIECDKDGNMRRLPLRKEKDKVG